MREYTQYEILSVSPHDACAQVKWWVAGDKTKCVIRVHHIPLEAELSGWDEGRLMEFWRKDVPDVPDIPSWLDQLVEEGRVSRSAQRSARA